MSTVVSDNSKIEKAIADRREATVSIALGARSTNCRGRFVSGDEGGFVFQPYSLPAEVIRVGAQPPLPAVFVCGSSGAAIEFQADIVAIEKVPSEGGTVAFTIRCDAPCQVNVKQRRSHFRAAAAKDPPVELLVWKIPVHWVLRDRPKPSMLLRAELVDVSAGGACLFILPFRLGPEAVAIGDRLRLSITHRNEEAVLEGQVVYRSSPRPDGAVRVGVEFRASANSIESRRASALLTQIIAAIQRHALRTGGRAIQPQAAAS
jgi:hypothetical protein